MRILDIKSFSEKLAIGELKLSDIDAISLNARTRKENLKAFDIVNVANNKNEQHYMMVFPGDSIKEIDEDFWECRSEKDKEGILYRFGIIDYYEQLYGNITIPLSDFDEELQWISDIKNSYEINILYSCPTKHQLSVKKDITSLFKLQSDKLINLIEKYNYEETYLSK